ncbi:MAG: hypothetical protein KDI09_16205, partial [Halioglobus sp.]|nr:hypothetical protein [Halioglobus sp.]
MKFPDGFVTMRLLFLAMLSCATPVQAQTADDAKLVDDHAVILLYHHVASDTPASTSVSPETFARHLRYLADEGYTVLSLEEVLWRLSKGKHFPKNSVAVTFDDAYASVY